MTTIDSNRPRTALIFAALLASSTSAFAQGAPADQAPAAQQAATNGSVSTAGESQEIIVTATKRSERIFDVPFSLNAQTQADIQRTGATNIEDISRSVAGLTVQNLGPGQSQVAIRGVSAGQIVRDQPGVKEQVGIYLDESVISLSLFTPDIDLFDINRVETLRGPQGTLFGSGSDGGTIRYITNQPRTDRLEGTIEGNVNAVDSGGIGGSLKGAINLPLNDKIAVRAVGYYTRYPGFIDALRPDGSVTRNVNDGDRYGGRIAVILKPTETLTITPRVLYQEIDVNGFNREEKFNLYGNPFTTTRPTVNFARYQQYLLLREKFRDKTFIADGTINLDLGPVTATSVTSYTNRDILVSRDASALTGSVTVDLGLGSAAVLLPSNLRDTTKLDSFTQEVRLSSSGNGRLKWLIGGFYAHVNRNYDQRLPTPGYDAATDAHFGAGFSAMLANGFPSDSPFNSHLPYQLEQIAAFGEATFSLTPKFNVTAGARYYDFHENRSFKTGGLFSNDDNRADSTKSSGATPRFLAQWKPTSEVALNLQASQGFRLGGVNDPLNVPLCSPSDKATFGGFQSYRDETLWNYEAGVKAHHGPVSFSGSFFYNDIRNLQVTLDAGSCSSRIVFNVPKAHAAGLEFELGLRPARGLDFSFSGNLVQSRFDSSVTSNGQVLAGIRAGNRLPSVPQYQLAATGTYSFEVAASATAVLSATVQEIGDRFTQPSDQENNPRSFVSNLPFGGATGLDATRLDLRLPPYENVNLSAAIELQHGLSLTAYVTNVLNQEQLLSFDRERGGRARLGFTVGQPRTFGLTGRKTF